MEGTVRRWDWGLGGWTPPRLALYGPLMTLSVYFGCSTLRTMHSVVSIYIAVAAPVASVPRSLLGIQEELRPHYTAEPVVCLVVSHDGHIDRVGRAWLVGKGRTWGCGRGVGRSFVTMQLP